MFSGHIRSAGVASLSLLLAACSGIAPAEQLPQVIGTFRPNTLAAEPIPDTLDTAIETLNRGLSGVDMHAMQVLSEEDAVTFVYRGGQWLRRHWLDSRDGGLQSELTSAGFDNPDDMADAALTSLWRRLHGRPVDLNGQVHHARALRDGTDISARSVVFSDDAAHALISQCSRRVPTSITGAWTPDSATLRRLARGLISDLQQAIDRATPAGHRGPRATDYYRQYGGLIVGERRMIYVNGFHRAYLSVISDRPERATSGERMR